jgi:hypothetical protein
MGLLSVVALFLAWMRLQSASRLSGNAEEGKRAGGFWLAIKKRPALEAGLYCLIAVLLRCRDVFHRVGNEVQRMDFMLIGMKNATV